MREHKYRAWDKKEKGWLNEFDFAISGEGEIYLYTQGISEDGFTRLTEDLEIVQHTGLKDKNGKEIYEGDILRIFDRNYEVKVKIVSGCKVFIDYGYPNEHNGSCNYWSEVIGNIYENPELMEEEG